MTNNEYENILDAYAQAALENMSFKDMYQFAYDAIVDSWDIDDPSRLLDAVRELYPHILNDYPHLQEKNNEPC